MPLGPNHTGLLLFAQKDLDGAPIEFTKALEQDPADVVSINNCALCMMCKRHLVGATRFLDVQGEPSFANPFSKCVDTSLGKSQRRWTSVCKIATKCKNQKI